MSIGRATGIFLLGCVCNGAAEASNRHDPSLPLEEISYRPVGKLIYLPVRVNGRSRRWFCLDSGAPESIIDQAAADHDGIAIGIPGMIQGAGKGSVQAFFGPPVRLRIGKLTTTAEHPRIVDLSPVPLAVRADGLIGADFFEKYVVRIDTDRHRIAFFDPRTFQRPSNAASIPLEDANHRLFVELYLEPRPGSGALRRLRVDTGSEDSVDDDTVKNSATVKTTRLGNGLGSSYVGFSGIYSSVGMGPYKFSHVWGPAGAVPIVGMEMMRRFTLTFDVPNGVLYLEPNRHLNEPIPAPPR